MGRRGAPIATLDAEGQAVSITVYYLSRRPLFAATNSISARCPNFVSTGSGDMTLSAGAVALNLWLSLWRATIREWFHKRLAVIIETDI